MSARLIPPTRPDGSPRTFWYDREGQHMIWRRPDGSMEAIGWECRHDVVEACSD